VLQQRFGFDVLRFQEANFGVAEKRTKEFCETLVDLKLPIHWNCFEYKYNSHNTPLPDDVRNTWQRYNNSAATYGMHVQEGPLWMRHLLSKFAGKRLERGNYKFPVERKLYDLYVRATGQSQQDLSEDYAQLQPETQRTACRQGERGVGCVSAPRGRGLFTSPTLRESITRCCVKQSARDVGKRESGVGWSRDLVPPPRRRAACPTAPERMACADAGRPAGHGEDHARRAADCLGRQARPAG
jgi:hypothetical protein